ncbi:retrovirus-related Pol polyprotein from transposon 297 [Sander vitreus]
MFVEDFFKEETDELECTYMYWHENKCAVALSLTDKQRMFFRIPHSHAHISLSKSSTDQWRNLGQFVLDCDGLTDWTKTVDGNVYTSPSTGVYRKLLSHRVTAARSVFQRKEAETRTHIFLNNAVNVSPTEISPLLSQVPTHLWAAHKYDVGLIKNCQPVVITPRSDFRPKKHQYPLKQEAIDGIRPVFNSLLKAGVIVPCPDSPVRTPIFPVKKIRDKGKPVEWRFVQDLKAVNAAVHARAPNVPNPYTILQGIPGGAQYFSVVDLSNAFFSVPVDKNSQFWFVFLFDGKAYTFTRLGQGFVESPTIYNEALRESLESLTLSPGSALLQYVDDCLIASPTKAQCEQDTIALLCHLATEGHKASLDKLQFVKKEVHFLGHDISASGKHCLHLGLRQ